MTKDVLISKPRATNGLSARTILLCLLVTIGGITFPSQGLAQQIVEGAENLLHYSPLEYSRVLRTLRIQGTVVLEAVLDQRGHVTDARVLSGPLVFQRGARTSVLEWHYAASTEMPRTVRVAIEYKLPTKSEPDPRGLYKAGPRPAPLTIEEYQQDGILTRIEMVALSNRMQEELRFHLPIREDQRVEKADWANVERTVVAVCEHLELRVDRVEPQAGIPELVVRIFHPGTAADPLDRSTPPHAPDRQLRQQ